MARRIRRNAGRIALSTTALLSMAAPAWAQKPIKPPEESVTLQWVIAFGIIFVIAIAAFLNPKRSHLA
jgi:hypothetical protein